MTSVAILHRDTIIARMRKGDRLADIARDLGFSSHASISMRLKDDPEYQEARIDSLAQRMDDREAELELADDNVTIARARELLSHARWRAEREAPQVWGAKHEQTITHKGLDLDTALQGARKALQGRTIDVTPTIVSDQDAADQSAPTE
jgi:hypothetical protein